MVAMVQSLDDARRRQNATTRVPPHNLEAERSLLGAMLLSRDAIAAAVETCGSDDFYKPAHGHVFDAITTLYGQGEPADPLTVADVLSRAGLLDAVGGLPAIAALQHDTPATNNAARYARIVEEHALLRKLIGVAGEIAELGYSVPDDVADAVDHAESLVFGIAERRVADTLKPLRELLEDSLDRLETLFNRSEAITGVPTGFRDLDERLSGLQPSALVIVGARPAMGKALGLDTPVPTPSGWTTMGELRVGDQVLDETGRPCRVTYCSPVYRSRPCYRVTFDDGSSLIADADHQWWAAFDRAGSPTESAAVEVATDRGVLPTDRGRQPVRGERVASERVASERVVTTEQMRRSGVTDTDGHSRWSIPVAGPLDLPAVDLPVDPYQLGYVLASSIHGQGGPGGSNPALLDRASLDPASLDPASLGAAVSGPVNLDGAPAAAAAGWADTHHHPSRSPAGRPARAGEQVGSSTALLVRSAPVRTRPAVAAGPVPSGGSATGRSLLADAAAGRVGRIPAAYLRSSRLQRRALLCGILDRCGVSDVGGWVECRLSTPDLARDVRELVCSLGHKVGPVRRSALDGPGGPGQPSWRFRWRPHEPVLPEGTSRTGSRVGFGTDAPGAPAGRSSPRHAIRSILPVPSVPVRCIAVDSPRHVYLAGESMIPTHNTAFALGIAAHATMVAHVPTLVFSLEMSHAEITQRLLVSEARVDSSRVRNGRLHDSDWPKISNAIGRLGEAPLYVDDNPNLTVMELRAKARRLKAKEGGLGLIIIDYLQLMSGRSAAENRQVEVSEISRGLKILARELDIPVVALSQLSRNLETRADKRPVLADLRESGSLEQDADVVMFLYRDEMYNADSADRGTAEVIVAKHRNGPTGTTSLAFVDHYTRFADMARV
jgi:replicative DNA helicase